MVTKLVRVLIYCKELLTINATLPSRDFSGVTAFWFMELMKQKMKTKMNYL